MHVIVFSIFQAFFSRFLQHRRTTMLLVRWTKVIIFNKDVQMAIIAVCNNVINFLHISSVVRRKADDDSYNVLMKNGTLY